MPYIPRSRNVIQTVFKNHYLSFEQDYYDTYAEQYGQFRLPRIQQAVTRFVDCGDYTKGITRIKCTNKECSKIIEHLKKNKSPPFDRELQMVH